MPGTTSIHHGTPPVASRRQPPPPPPPPPPRWSRRAAALHAQLCGRAACQPPPCPGPGVQQVQAHNDDAAAAAVHATNLFQPSFRWTEEMTAAMALDGHVVLPGLLTPAATACGLDACARVQAIHDEYTIAVTPLRGGSTCRPNALRHLRPH